jgi:hypothetical protein
MVECHPTRVKHGGRDKFGLLLAQSGNGTRPCRVALFRLGVCLLLKTIRKALEPGSQG